MYETIVNLIDSKNKTSCRKSKLTFESRDSLLHSIYDFNLKPNYPNFIGSLNSQ